MAKERSLVATHSNVIRNASNQKKRARNEKGEMTLRMSGDNVQFSKWANKEESRKDKRSTTACNCRSRQRLPLFRHTLVPQVPHQHREPCVYWLSSSKRKIALTSRLATELVQEACEGVTQLRYLSSLDLSPDLQQSPSRTKRRESHSHSRNWTRC